MNQNWAVFQTLSHLSSECLKKSWHCRTRDVWKLAPLGASTKPQVLKHLHLWSWINTRFHGTILLQVHSLHVQWRAFFLKKEKGGSLPLARSLEKDKEGSVTLFTEAHSPWKCLCGHHENIVGFSSLRSESCAREVGDWWDTPGSSCWLVHSQNNPCTEEHLNNQQGGYTGSRLGVNNSAQTNP